MEKKLTKLEHSHVQVDVVVDKDTWVAAQDKAMKKAAENVEIKGFRKGKAPLDMVKARIDQVKVMDDAINALLPEIYKDILTDESVKPVAQPKVDVTKLSDSELEVKFVIANEPEIKLGAYKGLAIGKTEAKVTAKEVNEAIDVLLRQNATLVVKEGAAEKGDTVVLDFAGTVDGVAFDGGSAQNHELELGSGQFIPGFEDQLIGASAGSHVDVNVTFPEQYTANLAGKAAVFACDIHEVKTRKLPELNDEFVKEQNIAGVETVDAFKDHKKNELTSNKQKELKREYLGKLFAEIAKNSEIDLPEEMVESQVASMKKDMENRMSQSGLTLEQYLQFVGQTEEDFMKKLHEDAIRDINNYFILHNVAKVEGLEISDADLEFEMAKLADQYNMKLEDVKKALEPQKEEFRNNVMMGKTEDFLYNENK